MKRILILVALGLFLCSTANAQGGGGEPTKKPATTAKAKPKLPPMSAPKPPDVKPPRTRAPLPPPAPLFGDITIASEPPDCLVLLNGEPRGRTSQEGSLTLSNLKPGRYNIILRKPTYRDSASDIDVIAGEKHEQRFVLNRMPGKLHVSTTPGGQITISGKGFYDSSVTDFELAAGNYEVTVEKPGFHTATHTVIIEPEKTVNLSVPLEPLSSAEIEETDWQGIINRNTRSDYQLYLSKYPEGKYASTAKERIMGFDVEEARGIRERQRSQELAALKGITTLATGNVDLKTLSELFDRGEEVVFNIKYYNGGFSGSLDPSQNMKNGRIRVRKNLVSFEPLEGSKGFSVSPDKILNISNEPPLRLSLKVAIQKGNKEDKKDFVFYHPSAFAFLTRQSVLGGVLNPMVTKFQCDGCDNSIAVLFRFLQSARESQQIAPVPPSGKR